MSVTGPRLLDKHFASLDITLGDPAPFPADFSGDDWGAVENAATPTFRSKSYIDLTGISEQDLTTFIQRVDVQEAFPPFGTAPFHIVDMVTTEVFTDAEMLTAYLYDTGAGQLPGFQHSNFSMEQVVFGRTRRYATSQEYGDLNLKGTSTWGTGAATAASRLYLTRVVMVEGLPSAVAATTVHIAASDFVLGAVLLKEPELEHMMRLKRSYEIAPRVG